MSSDISSVQQQSGRSADAPVVGVVDALCKKLDILRQVWSLLKDTQGLGLLLSVTNAARLFFMSVNVGFCLMLAVDTH